MSNELVAFERMLEPLKPHFAEVLGPVMPVDRLFRTLMLSVEKTPKLLQCNRQSLINSAMSAACLGLEVDGVTGQAFLLPFRDQAQLVIGYKGMNTLAARSGFTINGEVVREGDVFDYELGDKGFVRHKPQLGNKNAIVAAWATASAIGRPPIIAVLGIDDIMEIKAKSPGAKRSESPWNDSKIGFPAMASKSAKRRLARSMPLNVMQVAAAFDEAYEERGKHAWIDPKRGLQIEGEAFHEDRGVDINNEQRGTQELLGPKVDTHLQAGREAAGKGTKALEEWWVTLPRHEKVRLLPILDSELKPAAAKIAPAGEPQSGQILSPQGAGSGAAVTEFKTPTTAAEYLDVAHKRINADRGAASTWYNSAAQVGARKFLGLTEEMNNEILEHLNEST